MEHTKGKVKVSEYNETEDCFYLDSFDGFGSIICKTTFNKRYKNEAKANAELISDAFNTTNESGLTPSELYKQNQELFECLIIAHGELGSASNEISFADYERIEQAINNAKAK